MRDMGFTSGLVHKSRTIKGHDHYFVLFMVLQQDYCQTIFQPESFPAWRLLGILPNGCLLSQTAKDRQQGQETTKKELN